MTPNHHPESDRPRWDDQHELLLNLARADLAAGQSVVPTLIAFSGTQPLTVMTIRPFEGREHQQALLELSEVARLLGADRLLLSLAGRAWSTRDPIPPVVDDQQDLRQRVVVLHEALVAEGEVLRRCAIYPHADEVQMGVEGLVDEDDTLGDPVTTDDPEGWVTELLCMIVEMAADRPPQDTHPTVDGISVADIELASQVVRCEELGHRFAWGPSVHDRLRAALDLLLSAEVA